MYINYKKTILNLIFTTNFNCNESFIKGIFTLMRALIIVSLFVINLT